MSRLKILLRGAQINDLVLQIDREYIAGRKESCDILLQPEKGISREHFKLNFIDGNWIVTSLSRFGEMYSLGKRVENIKLDHGQVFQVPPYEFSFSDVPEAQVNFNSEIQQPFINENEKTVFGAIPQVPYLKMLSSDGSVREMLRLEIGDTWVAGRDPSCQVIIPDQRVSRRQFEIRKINRIYAIIDLSSINGTFVNGSPISSTEEQTLKSGDAISVLDNLMYFELHDPNFQYRVERIEVPPIAKPEDFEDTVSQFDVGSVDLTSESPINNDQVEEFDDPEHLKESGHYNPQQQSSHFQQASIGAQPELIYNQGYHNPQQNNQGFSQAYSQQGFPPGPIPESTTALQRLLRNKPLFISIILLFFAVGYYVFELTSPTQSQQISQVDSSDPFSKLTVEQKKNIESWYSFAEKALAQQAFSEAIKNLEKIYSLLPTGYKDSDLYLAEAKNGEANIIALQENERRTKEEAELKEAVRLNLEKCEKEITPDTTLDEIQNCLAFVSQNDPANEKKDKLIAQVEKFIEQKRLKLEEQSLYSNQVQALKDIFAEAEKVNMTGYPKKTIRAYEKVIISSLPDPGFLKNIARKRIKLIEQKLAEKNKKNLDAAEVFLKDGQLKEGIIALRKALDFDPDNEDIKYRIEKYTNELRNQVKVIYQDSIIDENFGNIDGEENRQGAKEKWTKIIKTDLEDGDYYRKAFIKLKKYGVF